mmetsp:Transcript_17485/g.24522  ORF Transcript_17485/g.24522 Transcript_17485/m.24522 type:complete len:169 (+) Transcript_17485:618-1124(+)
MPVCRSTRSSVLSKAASLLRERCSLGGRRGRSLISSSLSGGERSSSWLPDSTSLPSCRTKIRSLSLIVLSRCAMTRAEPFFASSSRVSWTSASFSLSRAEVASSKRITSGLRIMARAMANLCLWPPDKFFPPSDIIVISLSGFSQMKSQALASLQAWMIWASVAPSSP